MSLSDTAREEFFAECSEIIDRVNGYLTLIEKGQQKQETMDSLYRDIHTLKGTSQLFGFTFIGKITHAMESSLEPLRKIPNVTVSADFLNALNKCLELIENLYETIKAGQEEKTREAEFNNVLALLVDSVARNYNGDYSLMVDSHEGRLAANHEVSLPGNYKKNVKNAVPQSVKKKSHLTSVQPERSLSNTVENENLPDSDADVNDNFRANQADLSEPVASTDAGIKEETLIMSDSAATNDSTAKKSSTEEPPKDVVSSSGQQANQQSSSLANSSGNSPGKSPASPSVTAPQQDAVSGPDSTIRVPVQLLDKVMNLVGELVLARNQNLQLASKSEDMEFLTLSQNLNIVTSNLQAEVMKTRMQPIGTIFGKYQRVIRDIAHSLSKKIELQIQGAETELDKTLLEAIKDPLTHIIRNSCDHGLEKPEDRRAAGKSEHGTVFIKAYHEGGQVVVEVSDDGRGLNEKRIASKAVEKNLITSDQADRMTERELANLIFMPGFSTAETVTSVSGRGVGMDVVKTNIEKIGGTIDLVSKAGKGMTISLRIPLTLAIVPAMIVRSGQERFAIPQVKLVQLVRVEKGVDGSQQVEMLQGKPVYRLRGRLLPLISLKEVLGDIDSASSETELTKSDIINIVVLTSEHGYFGLIVDQILDAGDIVVKPLSQFIKALDIFSGATIMGDGAVAFILDVNGVSRKLSGEVKVKKTAVPEIDNGLSDGVAKEKVNADAQEFLLFQTHAPGKYAIPLCLVHRLEEFPEKNVEVSGAQRVIRYRDAILPLISLNKVLNLKSEMKQSNANLKVSNPIDEKKSTVTNSEITSKTEQTNAENTTEISSVSVIVVQKNSKNYGIEVNAILDVVYITENIDDSVRDRKGLLGSTVYNAEVVVVVDILSVIEMEINKNSATRVKQSSKKEASIQDDSGDQESGKKLKKNLNVLLAEDTPFFRKHITRFLEKAGHRVTAAVDGEEALKILNENKSAPFDLILSDIEMPKLNGFDLARAIRKMDLYKKTPLVAVTSRYKQKDLDEGSAAGFDRYLEKLNEETLLNEIAGLF